MVARCCPPDLAASGGGTDTNPPPVVCGLGLFLLDGGADRDRLAIDIEFTPSETVMFGL